MIWLFLFGCLILISLVMSSKRPGIALGLILMMFGLEQFLQTRDAIFVTRSWISNVGIGAVVLFAAMPVILKKFNKLSVDRIHLAVLVLFAFAFLSQLWTLSPETFFRTKKAIPYFILFFGLAPIISSDIKGISQGIWTALYVGIPLVFLFVFLVTWEGRGIRLAAPVFVKGKLSFTSPPLALATMAAQTGILSIVLVSKNKLLQLLQFSVFALAVYVAYRTQSRGQLIALAIVTLFCYPLANQGTKLKQFVVATLSFIVLGIIVYIVFQSFDHGGVNRWNQNAIRHAAEGRAGMSAALLSTWLENGLFSVLFGLGVNSSFATSGFYVHNLPCEILGEYGFFGASIFIFIYFDATRKAFRVIKKLHHYPHMRREIVMLIALLLFSTIVSMKEGSMSSWPHLFFYAIAISHLEKHSRQFVASQRSLREIFMTSFYNGSEHSFHPTMR